jgi:hypothetical protein
MPEKLVDYLYCLQQRGSGKIEFKKNWRESQNSSDLQITVGGKQSGVVLIADAAGGYSSADVAKLTQELAAKLDPTLTQNCKQIVATGTTQCVTVTRTVLRASDWERTNWSETLNPPLDLQVAYNERIIGGKVETKGSGVIFVSPVSVSPDGRTAHAQCAAQYDPHSYGFCRIVVTVDVTTKSNACP